MLIWGPALIWGNSVFNRPRIMDILIILFFILLWYTQKVITKSARYIQYKKEAKALTVSIRSEEEEKADELFERVWHFCGAGA